MATTSKYIHHIAVTTAIPSVEAMIVRASRSSSLPPTPSATTDSPSATIRMRPWRSLKCPGESCHPSESWNSGPAKSSRSAAAQIASRRPESRNAAARIMSGPATAVGVSFTTESSSAGLPRAATP